MPLYIGISMQQNKQAFNSPRFFRFLVFMWTSSASSRTRFMYSSKPCSCTYAHTMSVYIYSPSVLWHCRQIGVRKSIWPVKTEWWLSVWSQVQIVCIWSSWCLCHPKTPSSVQIGVKSFKRTSVYITVNRKHEHTDMHSHMHRTIQLQFTLLQTKCKY